MVDVKFYAVEGLDGVGKSTLVKNLADIGYATFKTPSIKYQNIRSEIHTLDKSSFFYYLSSVAFVTEKEGLGLKDFFVDRYLFSSITQYVSKTSNPTVCEFNKYFSLFKDFFILPTITFFITLDYEDRMSRIADRKDNEKVFDNCNIEYDNFWRQCINTYSYSNKIILDGQLSEDALLESVISHIKD